MHEKLFECHVVYKPEDRDKVLPLTEEYLFNTSYIVGDDDLGDMRLLYATRRCQTFWEINTLKESLIEASRKAGISPLRAKIEVTLSDEKFF